MMISVRTGAAVTDRLLLERAIALIICACICVAFLAAFAGGRAISARAVTATVADSGSSIGLSKGDTLVVSLGSNPGTGYAWQVAKNDARPS